MNINLTADLIVYHQACAEEHYTFARWVAKKASTQRPRFEWGLPNDYVIRCNQFDLEADIAAKHAATARILMGVD